MGGLHPALCRSIDFAADPNKIIVTGGDVNGDGSCPTTRIPAEDVDKSFVGLIEGGENTLSIFHAERHVYESNFRITTSIGFQIKPPSAFDAGKYI